MSAFSLRKRLILIILLPLICISLVAGYWRYTVAQRTAEELYDRSLVAVALAISRDVEVSGGDALSSVTRDLMRNAAAGDVYYHVYGPDGAYVTGYATPPLPSPQLRDAAEAPTLFDAIYRGEEVRAVRLREESTLAATGGVSTVTVWQTLENRNQLARELASRAGVVIFVLISTVAAVVYFGVELGLGPLTNLEAAISRRGSNDLSPIKRPLPEELSSLVQTLNALFARVHTSMVSKDEFISNAAHQLRNPVASVLSIAQSLRSSPDDQELTHRIEDLITASRYASRLTNQLLSYERARADLDPGMLHRFDLIAETKQVVDRIAPKPLRQGIDVSFDTQVNEFEIYGDQVLFAEAIENLVDNALTHGGPELSAISVDISTKGDGVCVSIRDNGKGIPQHDHAKALSRFSQIGVSGGSGLGLPIAASVADALGGALTLSDMAPGLCVDLVLPSHGGILPGEPFKT